MLACIIAGQRPGSVQLARERIEHAPIAFVLRRLRRSLSRRRSPMISEGQIDRWFRQRVKLPQFDAERGCWFTGHLRIVVSEGERGVADAPQVVYLDRHGGGELLAHEPSSEARADLCYLPAGCY